MNYSLEESLKNIKDIRNENVPCCSADTHWHADMLECCVSLESILKSSEQDFMDLGNKLIDFYGRAMDMSGISQSVLDVMTGGDFHAITQDISILLDDLHTMMLDSGQRFNGIIDVLNRYQAILQSSEKSLDDFIGMVINLNILGLFTRVENAHVTSTSDSGFASLTSDVKRLAQEIKIKSQEIRQHSATADDSIDKALKVIHAFSHAEGASMRTMLGEIVNDHHIMTHRYTEAVGAAEKIAAMSRGISDSTGRIVESLQFHDISRQRIEHVVHIIRSLCDYLDTAKCTSEQKVHLMKNVCGLQKAQVTMTNTELVDAMEKVKSDLLLIAGGVEEILHATNDVALVEGSSDTSFMSIVCQGIETLMQSLDKATDEEEELLKTVRLTCERVSYMTDFVKEIESLGEDLQLVALNARIKAAHLGADGAALDAISNNIYAVSQAASQETLKLSGILGEVGAVSKNFEDELVREKELAREKADIRTEKLVGIKASLAVTMETLQNHINGLCQKGASLTTDIEKTHVNVTVHTRIQDVLQEVIQILGDIHADALLMDDGGEIDTETEKFLNDLNQLYTMQSERCVHSQLATHESGNGESSNASVDKNDDLADNIELF